MSKTSKNSTSTGFQGYTILIVDDNPTNLGVFVDYLEEHGFTTLVARNGESGLRRARYVQPDIILLDVMMPDIDGFETCRRLKANEITQDIPVIFMTALADAEDKVKGFEVGAVDYVTKPLEQKEVLARVTTHLRLRDLTRSLKKQNLRLETSNQVGQQATSILDLDELLTAVVESIQSKFEYYFVGIWLLTEQKEAVTLQSGTGHDESWLLGQNLCFPLASSNNIIVWVCQTEQPYLAGDVSTDARPPALKTLPETRSELAIPLHVGQEMVGVLDIHSDQVAAFEPEDKTVLQTLANQIAIAIHNARLYELEKELRGMETERARELAELNASKDQFYAIVSQDLRSPFNALLGNAELMLVNMDQLTQQEIQKMAQRTYSSAEAVYNSVETLLTWSSMQRKHMDYQPDEINLRELAHKTLEAWRETAIRKNIELSSTIDQDIFICADENMLETVIRNLMANAFKFTRSGSWVTLSARPANSSAAGRGHEPTSSPKFIEVSIADMGAGISEEDMGQLFKIDMQRAASGTGKEKGAGLGLIMCKEMVELNGGKIWIESELGIGTTVSFTVSQEISEARETMIVAGEL